MLEPLEASGWRAFRLLLMALPDPEIQAVEQHLQREMTHRQECESSWARLFFSSLSAVDLQRADAEIRYECSERVEMLRKLEMESQSGMPSVRKKTRRKPKAERA